MTPEAQRIAIAESAGLTKYGPLVRMTRKGNPDPNGVRICYHVASKGGWTEYADVPDYLNDLNAMHEVEKILIRDNKYFSNEDGYGGTNFIDKLIDVCGDYKKAYHTTAAQRAEAYLKTIGKWEESA